MLALSYMKFYVHGKQAENLALIDGVISSI